MKEKKWYSNAVGYIIYPQSFKDDNHDGIGDLKGIESKLDYLSSLGIDFIWICPIFASPMDDNGYDVSSYYDVNPLYGNNQDLKDLIEASHRKKIRVLLDLVLNHTSDEHPWFKEALSNPSSKQRNYYIIKKGKYKDGKLLPPNNWKGFFETSAWERIGDSDDFYLHLFSKKMPDLNWENPLLREEIYKIATYYLDLGIDGFRLDAVAHLAKDTSFEDSNLQADENGLVMDTSKFSNREEVFHYLELLKENVFSKYDCLVVGEAGGCISPEASLKMTDKEKGSIDMVFNFDTVWNNNNFASLDKKDEEIKTDVNLLRHNFMRWYQNTHLKAEMPLYWCNHDHPRVVSQYGNIRFRKESAKMLLTTLLFLYGTPFLYNGEEIGMSNNQYTSIEDFYNDVSTRNELEHELSLGYSKEYLIHYLNRTCRLNARSPMQWDDSSFAGFSTYGSINKVNPNYLEGVNVKDESEDPDSILNFYKKAIKLRKREDIGQAVLNETLEYLHEENEDVFAYKHLGKLSLSVISNFREHEVKYPYNLSKKKVLLHNYKDVSCVDNELILRPFESFLVVQDD